MALIVQKFGGSSVKDRDRIFNVARIVANTHNAGNDVVVVVSAQGDTTDDLIAKAGEITHNPSAQLIQCHGQQPDRLAGWLPHRPRLYQGAHHPLGDRAHLF